MVAVNVDVKAQNGADIVTDRSAGFNSSDFLKSDNNCVHLMSLIQRVYLLLNNSNIGIVLKCLLVWMVAGTLTGSSINSGHSN